MKDVIGRISKNPYQDLVVFCALYRGRPRKVRRHWLRTFCVLSPETVRDLLPLLSEAQALAERLGEDEGGR